MITCIAVDNEPLELEVIVDYASRINFLNMVATFRDAVDAISYIQTHTIDLVFLDINMPVITGMQFVKPFPRNAPK